MKTTKRISMRVFSSFAALLLCASLMLSLSSCISMGLLFKEKLKAENHEHSFTEWEVRLEASCTSEGEEIRRCVGCERIDKKKIPMTSHTEAIDEAVAPSCEDNGATQGKHCSVCNAVLEEQQIIEAVGHSYTESVEVDSRCDREGVKRFDCDNCESSYTENFSHPEYTASEIYDKSKNSVGEIITYDKNGYEYALGTGFVYSADGKIITNYHVIEDAYSAKITINRTTYNIQKVLAYDKNIDVAVLKINAIGLTELPICKSVHHVGKPVYAFGSSKGLTATFSQGIITYSEREVDGVVHVQHDAAISSGNSGGPLINQYGEIIGINTWTVRDSQNLNFAIAAKELDNLRYGTPLTMREFYEKECDVFTKVKNYIINNGTYDGEDNEYYLSLGYSYSSDYSSIYSRSAYYNVTNDEISLYFFIDSDNLVCIDIDEIDAEYDWMYYDSDEYYMMGILYANEYDSDSLLGYYDHNIYYSSLRDSVRSLASSMVSVLCSYMTEDFSDIGVTAADLGFICYY